MQDPKSLRIDSVLSLMVVQTLLWELLTEQIRATSKQHLLPSSEALPLRKRLNEGRANLNSQIAMGSVAECTIMEDSSEYHTPLSVLYCPLYF